MKKFIYPALSIHNVLCANVIATSEVSGADLPGGPGVGGGEEITGDAPARQASAIDPHIETSNPLPH